MQISRHGKDFSHHNDYLLGRHSTPRATANPHCVLMGSLSMERKGKKITVTLIYSLPCSSSVPAFFFKLHGQLLLDFLDQHVNACRHIALSLRRSFLQMLVRPILLFPLWFFLKAPIYRDRHNNLPLNATKTMDYSDQYNLIVTFYSCCHHPSTVSCQRLQSGMATNCPYVHCLNSWTEP